MRIGEGAARAAAIISSLVLIFSPVSASADMLLARPANFYTLEFSVSGVPCEEILNSLNEPYRPTTIEQNITTNPAITTDLFLRSRLQINWQRRPISFGPGQSVQLLDFAAFDFAGSNNQIVVRWSFFSSGRLMNELFEAPESMLEQLKAITLQPSIIRTVAGSHDDSEIKIDPRTAPELWGQGRGPKSYSFDSDVIVVDGRTLFLIMDAVEAADAEFQSGSLRVYTLQLRSQSNLGVVCSFTHGAPA